jgi:hypothetical protein
MSAPTSTSTSSRGSFITPDGQRKSARVDAKIGAGLVHHFELRVNADRDGSNPQVGIRQAAHLSEEEKQRLPLFRDSAPQFGSNSFGSRP